MACEIVFRQATSDDYENVMNISDNIYEGMDHLPVRYHDYCKDPQRHMFVAEADGKVVGFLMRFIIDGGRSNAHQALRVHKDYTGRGIATLLGNYAHREIMKRCPTMQRTMYTAVDRAGVESALKKFPYQKLLGVRSMLSCVIERQNLPGILRITQFHNLKLGEEYPQCRRQSEDEALASLLQDVPFSQFVPAGMWIIDWEPLGHHVDNYQKVMKNSSFYTSRMTEDSPIQAISFFTCVQVPAGWRCRADFYCPSTVENPNILVAHAMRHLEEMASLEGPQHISYSAIYPETFPGHLSKETLFTQLQGLKHRGGVFESSALLISMNVADVEKYLTAKS